MSPPSNLGFGTRSGEVRGARGPRACVRATPQDLPSLFEDLPDPVEARVNSGRRPTTNWAGGRPRRRQGRSVGGASGPVRSAGSPEGLSSYLTGSPGPTNPWARLLLAICSVSLSAGRLVLFPWHPADHCSVQGRVSSPTVRSDLLPAPVHQHEKPGAHVETAPNSTPASWMFAMLLKKRSLAVAPK